MSASFRCFCEEADSRSAGSKSQACAWLFWRLKDRFAVTHIRCLMGGRKVSCAVAKLQLSVTPLFTFHIYIPISLCSTRCCCPFRVLHTVAGPVSDCSRLHMTVDLGGLSACRLAVPEASSSSSGDIRLFNAPLVLQLDSHFTMIDIFMIDIVVGLTR